MVFTQPEKNDEIGFFSVHARLAIAKILKIPFVGQAACPLDDVCHKLCMDNPNIFLALPIRISLLRRVTIKEGVEQLLLKSQLPLRPGGQLFL